MWKLFKKPENPPPTREDFSLKAADPTKDSFPYHKNTVGIEVFPHKSIWTTTHWASKDRKRWLAIGYTVKTIHEWSLPPSEARGYSPRRGESNT